MAASILAGVVLAGYGRIIPTYFLADDFLLIHNVLDGRDRADWTVAIQHLYSTQYVDTFRPVVTFLHTLGYAIWGVQPAGYHVLNLLFHAANALLVYTLVRRLSGSASPLLPLSAGALFATHPIHPEAVTYIGSLPILVCTTFYLSSLVATLRHADSPGRRWAVLSLVCFALALASKEEAISLPLAVALIAFALPPTPSRGLWARLARAARVSLPYFGVLALYLGYRRLIFGQIAPIYYGAVEAKPLDLLLGAAKWVGRLVSPVNMSYLGRWGEPIYIGMLAAGLSALAVSWHRARPPIKSVGLCAGAFLIPLIPLNRVLVLDPDPGLTNSRFLYLPSVAFVATVAVILCGVPAPARPRRAIVAAVVSVIGVHLVLLNVNNGAWSEASSLMRRLQDESRRLTGNMLHIEVANLPDTVHGVVFDRGGFRHALVSPFAPGSQMHRRERALTVPVPAAHAVESQAAFPERMALDAHVEPVRLGGARTGLRVSAIFAPRSEHLYRGEITIRHPSCPRSLARISVRGLGTHVSPVPTYLTAIVWPGDQFKERRDALTYLAAVADYRDGIAAEDVRISLPPGAPWSLRSFPLTAEWRREPPDTPVSIRDGGFRAFLLEITPIGRPRERFIAPRISALNAPTVIAVAGQTTIELSGPLDFATPDHPRPDTSPPSARPRGRAPAIVPCPELAAVPAELDFGVVPTTPQPLRQPRPFRYYGQAPAMLFWDDLGRRLMPMSRIETAPVILEASAQELSNWRRSPGLRHLPLSPSLVAFHATSAEQFIASRDIDIRSVQAAYVLLRMRVSGASSPYARLRWSGAAATGDSSASLVIVPDGYWHSYAIPVHSLPRWRSASRIRRLQLHPVLSEGWVEIESMKIIGPIPG